MGNVHQPDWKKAGIICTMALALSVGLVLVATRASAAPVITEYPVAAHPFGVTSGPDGAIWYTNQVTDSINRITTSGIVTVYTLPSIPRPQSITVGPDGALWFTLVAVNGASAGMIGRITTSGAITEYPLAGDHTPLEITAGPDGALWFTGQVGSTMDGFIGRITPSGSMTEYPYPSSYPELGGIVAGPDGALWFTEFGGNSQSTGSAIGRMTVSGDVSRYPITTKFGPYPGAWRIGVGPDGALWFTDTGNDKIGRIATDGTISEFASQAGSMWGLASGPDGALWFPDYSNGKIGRMTTAGVTTFYAVPAGSSSAPMNITVGPDSALWFNEYVANQIGRILPDLPPSSPTDLTASSPTQNPALSWTAVSGATSYNVYRDGTNIGSTTDTNFTDSTASMGEYTYYVTAVNGVGESGPSNTVTVQVVATPTPTATMLPTATSTPLPTPTPTTTPTPSPTPIPHTLSKINFAKPWIGLVNSTDSGIKFDLKAELYVNNTLVTTGQINSVNAGGVGFSQALLDVITPLTFSPVSIPQGTTVSLKLSVRNACTGSTKNLGTARLWFNDALANSRASLLIDGASHDYYLVANSLLSRTVGSGPQQTIDVPVGSQCGPFNLFGVWNYTS